MIDTIIDISHNNGKIDLAKMASAGVPAIIHKATQGSDFVDPMYADHKAQAEELGLLWGSYHFGTGVYTIDQVDNFMNTVNPTPNELIVLDFEINPGGVSMTLEQAIEFISIIYNEIGVYPMIYGGALLRESIGSSIEPILANCSLWYARYGHAPLGIPRQIWSDYTLWQFTDGAHGNGPYEIDGAGRCDHSRFNGTIDELKARWPFTK